MVLNYGSHKGVPHWGVNEGRPPGYSRIYFVTGGRGFYHDETDFFEFRENHVYLLPTSRAYSLSQDRNSPFACTFFHYDFFPRDFRKMIDIDLAEHPLLKNIQIAMENTIKINSIHLFHALAEVFTLYCHEQKLTLFSTGTLTPILEYIGENIKGDLSLAKLSLRAGFNEQYFIRLFRKEMGMTPHQYIIGYRIKEASKLLIQGKSVTHTAFETGFSDVKTFSRSFKNSTSRSPTAFIKEIPLA